MSWEDQGRQYHMWFGHGTAPVKAKDTSDDGIFGLNGLAQRIQAVAHGAVGALPQALRARAAAQYDAGNLERLSEAMSAWSRGTKLGVDEFTERFFGRAADDSAVEQLHRAALGVGLAQSHAELREASDQLADAMQAIGLDRWPRFLADAQERARDPATVAAVEKSSQPPDSGQDAIRPVYPVETAVGIAAAGAAGVAAAARAVAGAALRQILPKAGPRSAEPAGDSAAGRNTEKPKDTDGKMGEPGTAGTIRLSRSRFGHTFDNHGQDATEFLKNRARAMGQPNGQFIDNQAAAHFIEQNLDKVKGGPVSIPLPKGFPARIINPDGSFSPASSIRLVPRGNGVKTAYPEP